MNFEYPGNRWVGLLLVALCLPLAAAQNPARTLTIIDRNPYQKWLNEDVRYIITDQERADFKKLTTEQQRDSFIEAFWARRNPHPNMPASAFKEEHYRRIAFANLHFGTGNQVPGWRTDRGRFYIMWGPADSIDLCPAFSPPSETWHYSYIEGIGRNVALGFSDECRCGNYPLTKGESEPETFNPLAVWWWLPGSDFSKPPQ
jgi:GWxTD domain-containing protein